MELPDWAFFDQSINADSDPDAAANALLVIAKRLRNGDKLKPEVIQFLAGAIERSMTLPQRQRGPALLREFKLTYGGRRPVRVKFWEIGRTFDELTSAGKKRSDAIGEVADTYKIDESTVVRFLKEYRHCQEEEELSRPDDWDKPDDRK